MAEEKSIKPVSFRLNNELKQTLEDICRVRSMSVSYKLEELVRDYVEKNPLTKEEKSLLAQLNKIKEANNQPKPKKK
ncbi:MAG: hypothetical protein WDM78_11525 [Puia sp.]